MALGTIANAETFHDRAFWHRISLPGDSAYPTGGSPIDTALAGKIGSSNNVLAVIPQDCGGYHVAYDHVNGKLKVYRQDYDASADGPSVEVPNATDLSAVTFNLVVVSY